MIHVFSPFVRSFVRFLLHNKLEYILAFKEFHMRLPHCCVRYNTPAPYTANMSNKQKEIHWLYAMKCKVNSKLAHTHAAQKIPINSAYLFSSQISIGSINSHYITQTQCLLHSSSSSLSPPRSLYRNFFGELKGNFRLRFICKCLVFDCIQHLHSMSRITNYG